MDFSASETNNPAPSPRIERNTSVFSCEDGVHHDLTGKLMPGFCHNFGHIPTLTDFLVLCPNSSDQDPHDQDIIFHYQDKTGLLKEIRGVFLTLQAQFQPTSPDETTVKFLETHLNFASKEIVIFCCPIINTPRHSIIISFALDGIDLHPSALKLRCERLISTFTLLYGDHFVQSLSSSTHLEIRQILTKFFRSIYLETLSSSGINCNNYASASAISTVFDCAWHIRSALSDLLSELEAGDRSTLLATAYMPYILLPVGACLYYCGLLVHTHLPAKIQRLVNAYLDTTDIHFDAARGPSLSDSLWRKLPLSLSQGSSLYLLVATQGRAVVCLVQEAQQTSSDLPMDDASEKFARILLAEMTVRGIEGRLELALSQNTSPSLLTMDDIDNDTTHRPMGKSKSESSLIEDAFAPGDSTATSPLSTPSKQQQQQQTAFQKFKQKFLKQPPKSSLPSTRTIKLGQRRYSLTRRSSSVENLFKQTESVSESEQSAYFEDSATGKANAGQHNIVYHFMQVTSDWMTCSDPKAVSKRVYPVRCTSQTARTVYRMFNRTCLDLHRLWLSHQSKSSSEADFEAGRMFQTPNINDSKTKKKTVRGTKVLGYFKSKQNRSRMVTNLPLLF